MSSPYWGQEYTFSQAQVCIQLPESSVLVPSPALLLSSLTVTVGYITDHVIEARRLQLLTVLWRSKVPHCSKAPHFGSCTWSVWWPTPSGSNIEAHQSPIARQRHFLPEEARRGFRSLSKEPETKQWSPSLYPRVIFLSYCRIPPAQLSIFASWKPTKPIPGAISFCHFPPRLRNLLCLTFRLPPRFVWQLPLWQKSPSLLHVFLCECILNCMKISTSLI